MRARVFAFNRSPAPDISTAAIQPPVIRDWDAPAKPMSAATRAIFRRRVSQPNAIMPRRAAVQSSMADRLKVTRTSTPTMRQ